MNREQKSEIKIQDNKKDSLSSVPRSLSSEACVRCGSCKALCPTYMHDVTEGMSARGRVVLLNKFNDGDIEPSEALDKRLYSCILCGACNSLCPLGINITDAIYGCRKKIAKYNKKRRLLTSLLGFGLKRTNAGFSLIKFLEGINNLLPVQNILPFKIFKDLDIVLPDSPLRDSVSIFRVSKPRGRIAVFAGCSVNFLYPEAGRSLIKSLTALNYDVILPQGEACCGAPLLGLGLERDAAQLAEKNLKIFKDLNVEAVVGLCPTCIHFIKNEYIRLVGSGIDNAMEVPQFFMDKIQQAEHKRQKIDNKNLASDICHLGSVIYHDPCHSIYNLNVSSEPRNILKSLGTNIIDSDKGCCGFGGTFRLLYKELSESILDDRIKAYKNADTIVTSCPNCIIQLRSRLKNKPVKHIIEIIEKALKEEENEK
ncbi:MAG: (Fe-S)-binding protein [Thermodesulfovibrionales bacterium]|nr:(Fe-S)-binding protein [Thermodesulfovibrionales bacterium]